MSKSEFKSEFESEFESDRIVRRGRISASPDDAPERDDVSSNRHPAPTFRSSMIFSENRYPLFGIML
jgi:hypothetical protein